MSPLPLYLAFTPNTWQSCAWRKRGSSRLDSLFLYSEIQTKWKWKINVIFSDYRFPRRHYRYGVHSVRFAGHCLPCNGGWKEVHFAGRRECFIKAKKQHSLGTPRVRLDISYETRSDRVLIHLQYRDADSVVYYDNGGEIRNLFFFILTFFLYFALGIIVSVFFAKSRILLHSICVLFRAWPCRSSSADSSLVIQCTCCHSTCVFFILFIFLIIKKYSGPVDQHQNTHAPAQANHQFGHAGYKYRKTSKTLLPRNHFL